MTRHGVVLGGGGVLGVAWELGVLAALAQAGLDPVGTAAVVVGTSAGSVVGAQSAGGADLAELVAAQHAPPDERSARSGEIMAMLDFQLLADLFVRWTGAWPMTEDAARDCCELALKQTTIDEETFVGMIAATLEREWPDREIRVVTVACTTGGRTAWTKADGVPLARAVAASCSIPGILPPVAVAAAAGERHVDGGLWSTTNADLLVDDGLDAVLVVEPMSATTNQLGVISANAVAAETAALEARGVTVHVISGDAAYGALSAELLDPAKRPEALEIGRASGTAAVPAVAALLS